MPRTVPLEREERRGPRVRQGCQAIVGSEETGELKVPKGRQVSAESKVLRASQGWRGGTVSLGALGLPGGPDGKVLVGLWGYLGRKASRELPVMPAPLVKTAGMRACTVLSTGW